MSFKSWGVGTSHVGSATVACVDIQRRKNFDDMSTRFDTTPERVRQYRAVILLLRLNVMRYFSVKRTRHCPQCRAVNVSQPLTL